MSDWKSDDIKALAAALLEAQKGFPTVAKTADNPFHKSKYATLKDHVETIRPILAANGLVVTQLPNGETLRVVLVHPESGQWIAGEFPLGLNGKSDAQSLGSATTYARRYSYEAVLGIVTGEDDDGNAASGKDPSQQAAHGQTSQAGGRPPVARRRPSTAQKVEAAAQRAKGSTPAARPSGAITEPQKRLILAKGCSALGYDETRLLEEISTFIGTPLNQLGDLTKSQASDVIEELSARQAAPKQPAATAEPQYAPGEEPF